MRRQRNQRLSFPLPTKLSSASRNTGIVEKAQSWHGMTSGIAEAKGLRTASKLVNGGKTCKLWLLVLLYVKSQSWLTIINQPNFCCFQETQCSTALFRSLSPGPLIQGMVALGDSAPGPCPREGDAFSTQVVPFYLIPSLASSPVKNIALC